MFLIWQEQIEVLVLLFFFSFDFHFIPSVHLHLFDVIINISVNISQWLIVMDAIWDCSNFTTSFTYIHNIYMHRSNCIQQMLRYIAMIFVVAVVIIPSESNVYKSQRNSKSENWIFTFNKLLIESKCNAVQHWPMRFAIFHNFVMQFKCVKSMINNVLRIAHRT